MTSTNIIPADELSVFEVLKKLSSNQQQLAIIRPNNPPPGIAGYIFDIVGDDLLEFTSDITDHYIEDNTAVNDQIALRPEQITVRGFVGELVAQKPVASPVNPPPDPLTENPAMVPELSPGAQQTQDQTTTTKDASQGSIESAQSLYGIYDRLAGQKPNQTRQTKIFLYFYALWKGRQLFSVETPWGTMNDMAILAGRMEQPEETPSRSDMTMIFKHLRFAKAATVNVGQLAGRAFAQQSPVTQNGAAGLTPTTPEENQSLLRKWTKGMVTP